jgi:hypothetical protein
VQSEVNAIAANRPLTDHERRLARWMLEHGTAEARDFLPQLEQAEATPWQCACGCASINFQIKGHAPAPPGVHVLADFEFGEGEALYGVFIYASANILSGLEVCGYTGEAPKSLPTPEQLRPFESANTR